MSRGNERVKISKSPFATNYRVAGVIEAIETKETRSANAVSVSSREKRGLHNRVVPTNLRGSCSFFSHLALFLLLRSLSNVRSAAVSRVSDTTRYISQGTISSSHVKNILFASRRCRDIGDVDDAAGT